MLIRKRRLRERARPWLGPTQGSGWTQSPCGQSPESPEAGRRGEQRGKGRISPAGLEIASAPALAPCEPSPSPQGFRAGSKAGILCGFLAIRGTGFGFSPLLLSCESRSGRPFGTDSVLRMRLFTPGSVAGTSGRLPRRLRTESLKDRSWGRRGLAVARLGEDGWAEPPGQPLTSIHLGNPRSRLRVFP